MTPVTPVTKLGPWPLTPEEIRLELIRAEISEIWVPVIKTVTPEEIKLEPLETPLEPESMWA